MIRYQLKFITPLFSRGMLEESPEIRPPSIRGQLRWWFRALGGSAVDEKTVFGGVLKISGAEDTTSSRMVVRVANVQSEIGRYLALKHKKDHGNKANPLNAYAPGTTFDLLISFRGSQLPAPLRQQLDRCIQAWLHLGTLGLRGTRAAGSFIWEPEQPSSFEDYDSSCGKLLAGGSLKYSMLGHLYDDAEKARWDVSNTLGGPDNPGDLSDLRNLNWPLGDVASRKQQQMDRSRKNRKTSPLRFRIVAIEGKCRIAAVWDDRSRVTGNKPGDLEGIIRLLQERKPALGNQLAASGLT